MNTAARARPHPAEVRTIACLMLGEIGDVLVTTPTLAALRVLYPSAKITVIVRREMAPLLLHHPAVDALHIYRAPTVIHKGAFLLGLWFKRWDMWLDLHTPTFNTFGNIDTIFKRNALMLRFARTRFQVGFAVPRLSRHLSHPIPVPDHATLTSENIVDTTLRLVGGSQERAKTLYVGDDERIWINEWQQLNNPEGRTLQGLFFGAKQAAKFWSVPYVSAFIRQYVATWPEHRIVMIGGRHEAEIAAQILAQLSEREAANVVNAVDTLTLLQSAVLIQACAQLVTTDSGPMHMADALNKPLVALMSSHNYLPIWRPISTHARVLNAAVPCGPCLRASCDKANLCMNLLTPDEVVSALSKLQERASHASR